MTDIAIRYIHKTSKDAAFVGECGYMYQLCYNIYVTLSKASSLCSTYNNRDIVSKILCSSTKLCFRSRGDDTENMSNI